jgi:hypothetical protein
VDTLTRVPTATVLGMAAGRVNSHMRGAFTTVARSPVTAVVVVPSSACASASIARSVSRSCTGGSSSVAHAARWSHMAHVRGPSTGSGGGNSPTASLLRRINSGASKPRLSVTGRSSPVLV